MAISFTRYVSITSGVGGGAAVRARDLILLLFTADPRVPADAVVTMSSADEVKTYFGSASPEYLRAAPYFGFVSKLIASPRKIAFARWASAASAAHIYGISGTYLASQFSGVTNGSMTITLAGTAAALTGLNFSSATTMSQVAGVLQTAIRAAGATANWTSATVTYNATANRLEFVSGATDAATIAVSAGTTGTDVSSLTGWGTGAIFSPGVAVQEPVDAFTAAVQISDNFGSFAFVDDLTSAQVLAVATQNDTYNVKFLYLTAARTTSTASTLSAALIGLSGVAITYAPLTTEYPELLPAAVLAATNYAKRNSVQNYMFQQAALTPSVTTDAVANVLDPLRVNYYGRTQSAGQTIDFYQRGVMCGLATDPVDINVYANEMWFKDAIGAQIMTLLLSAARVSANQRGRGQVLAVLQSVIDTAVLNGTVSLGKTLSTAQNLYITNLTDDENAWQQVYRLGYWIDIVMTSYVTTDSRTEWKAVYTLIYSKDDLIRKVEGTHVLI